jgi:hypothetical protein
MAKKRGRPPGRRSGKAGVPETVGAALGTVMAKVDAWVAQRQVLANELQQVINRAQGMLTSLGGRTAAGTRRGRPQPPQGVGPMHDMSMLTAGRAPTRKRRAMSVEAREKIAAAQRARWARQKAASAGAGDAKPARPAKAAKKGKRGRKARAKGEASSS